MARDVAEIDMNTIDEAYIEARRAEIEAYQQLTPPTETATEEEKAAWARLPAQVQEAIAALQHLEATLKERRIAESRRRQQEVQWEVVRLRLRRAVGSQPNERRRQTLHLMSRMLPSEKGLAGRISDEERGAQRRYLLDAVIQFRQTQNSLPTEDSLAEAHTLLEYYSLLSLPRPQDPAVEHRIHLQLAEHARDLRLLLTRLEQQQAIDSIVGKAIADAEAGITGQDN